MKWPSIEAPPAPLGRGSETVGPVGPVGHRDLRADPDTSFAGPNSVLLYFNSAGPNVWHGF